MGVGAADWRSFSRFFSSVRRKALRVVRKALFGLQRPGETGVCAQTGQVSERDDWPNGHPVSRVLSVMLRSGAVQVSQIDWSQQGRRKAFTASLLQMAHRSLKGISSWDRVLEVDSD